MCQLCVSDGVMTQQELDAALAAGDRTVVSYQDRIAQGEDPEVLLAELRPVAVAFGYSGVGEMLTAIQRGRAAGSN